MTTASDLPEICQDSLAVALRPDLFKALCDPVRVSIVATLATRKAPSNVSDLASCCGIDFSGVSRHLKLLREAGVVSGVKDGRAMLYQLNTDHLIETLEGLAAALRRCREQAV